MNEKKDLAALRIDRTPTPVGGGRGGWVAFLLLAGAGAAWYAWQSGRLSEGRVQQLRTARVLRSGGADLQGGVAANGYVVARRRAALSTDIQGRIVELRVEEGQPVKQGELIARLDSTELEASRARLRANLGSARATLELARIQEPRARSLVGERVAPQSTLDEALATLHRAEADVRSLEAAEREVQVQIEKSSVFAPFAGVIVQKNAEVGEVVSTFGSGGPSSRGAVATLVDFDSLEVQVELAQTSLKRVRVGSPVLIYLDAWPEEAHRGVVRQIWPTADRQKATVELRATFEQRDARVLPEMGVRVVFVDGGEASPRPVEIRVPARAILPGPEPAVMVWSEGLVARRAIEVADGEKDGRLVVKRGLEGGETVVLDPPPGLKDGDAAALAEEDGK